MGEIIEYRVKGKKTPHEIAMEIDTQGLDPLDVLDEITRISSDEWSDRRHSAEGYIIYKTLEEKVGDEWYYGDMYALR